MLNKMKKLKSEGFTIIEVMIVLAIAGLIILVVLLAVPALQRNSRNTALKNDAAAIAAAVSEYSSNYNGATPSSVTQSDSEVTIGNGTNSSTAKVQAGTSVVTTTPGSDPGTLYVRVGQKCTSDTGTDTTTSRRSVAIVYNIETSSGVAGKCLDS